MQKKDSLTKNFNQGVKNMEPRYNFQIPKGIKRMHFNETIKPILNVKTLLKNIDECLNYYPEDKYEQLEQVASQHYKIKQNEIVCTNGSDEGIDLCVRTFCNPNDVVCVLKPGFSSYDECSYSCLCKIVKFNLEEKGNKWQIDVDKFIQFVKDKKAKLVFLSNPLAHVGSIIDKKSIEKIIKSLPETMIIIDEAYIEFTEAPSAISLFNKYKNLTILRTTSKFYGLAGIRLGFMITHFKDDVFKIKSLDNLNKITCQIGINLFKKLKNKHILKRKKYIQKRKEQILKWLKQFKEIDKIYESNANFIYMKLNCEGESFAKKLLNDYKIRIRFFEGDLKNYCRISIL